MTEHSVTDNIDHLPNWHEQLIFAEELNECMLAGCTGYIYWYMRAHWAFVGTGEAKYNPGNTKNTLLPRAYVMSHFSKHVTGSTRIKTSRDKTTGEGANLETSAYIKGDSLIFIAIDTIGTSYNLQLKLPFKVKSGTHLLSTGNEPENLCQEKAIAIDEPVKSIVVDLPARSLNTYIFMIDREETAIENLQAPNSKTSKYFDLEGRPLAVPHGLCIEQRADGTTRKVIINN